MSMMWISALLLLMMLLWSSASSRWNHWGYKHLFTVMAVLLLLILFPRLFLPA